MIMLIGERVIYLMIRPIITNYSIGDNNKEPESYSQCISLLRFLERSEIICLNSIKLSVFMRGNMGVF